MGREKTDWKEAKRLYVEEGLLIREIADVLGMTIGPVNVHCTQGKWKNARKAFLRKVAKKSLTVASNKRAVQAGNALAELSKVASKALGRIPDLMDDEDYRKNKLNISELVRVADLYHRVNMDLLSLQTQVGDMMDTVQRVLLRHIEGDEARKIMGEILEEARK